MPQQTLTVAREKTTVVLILDGARLVDLPWQAADDLQKALRIQVRAARAYQRGYETVSVEVSVGSKLSIRHEAGAVLVIGAGRLLFGMPPAVAERLWRAILIQARKAEEIVKADQIALDHALLIRAGVPFGLSNHPKIVAEATKEAVHNRTLRRAIPSIRSTEVFGTPAISQTEPSKVDQLRQVLSRMPPEERRRAIQNFNAGMYAPQDQPKGN